MTAEVEGRLEAVVDGRALGWAWIPEQPDVTVEVEIEVDGQAIATGVADIKRPTPGDAGIGHGRYGFDIALPEILTESATHKIRARAGSD